MASIYNRGSRALPNWWIGWIDRAGQHKAKKIGADRAIALQVKAKIENDLTAKRFDVQTEPPPPIPLLFGAAADEWIKLRSAIGQDGQPAIRSWRDDQGRVNLHLRPRFADRRLDEITVDDVKAVIETMRPTHKPQTIRNVLHTLSRLYEDQPTALRLTNPARQLKRGDRRRIGKGWDSRKTPFLKTKAEVRRLYLGFPEMSADQPFRAMYAVGAFAGLRPGEVRALEWSDVDFDGRRIHIQRSAGGPTKNGETRHVPLAATLAEVLTEWQTHRKLGEEMVFPCLGHHGNVISEEKINTALRTALAAAEMPLSLTTYQCTRHTFGAQWVINGGSLHKLADVLGHSTTEVTRRYAHLVPGEFTETERALVDVDLQPAKVIPLQARRA